MEEEGIIIPTKIPTPQPRIVHPNHIPTNPPIFSANFNTSNPFSGHNAHQIPFNAAPYQAFGNATQTAEMNLRKRAGGDIAAAAGGQPLHEPKQSFVTEFMQTFPEDLMHVRLSKLSADGLYDILKQIDDLKPTVDKLGDALMLNAISGRVLMHCDLAELKSVYVCHYNA